MKKIIAVFGSPRKNGNSAALVNEFLSSFDKEHTEIKPYYLIDMKIEPCKACYFCKTQEGCIIHDDMDSFYENFRDADIIVIGAPIYMFQVNGQTKQFIDRLYPLFKPADHRRTHKYPVKDTVMIYSQGAPYPASFQNYISSTNKALEMMGLKVVKTIVNTNGNTIRAYEGNLAIRKEVSDISKMLSER